jgi:hypothetical protein
MKRGLVSPSQTAYSYVQWREELELGAALGPYIVAVVPTGEDYPVAAPLYWVDVPDAFEGYRAYYNTTTQTPVEITQAFYWMTQDVTGYGNQGDSLRVVPATAPQPANTTNVEPPLPTGEPQNSVYWYDGGWVLSYFSPYTYSTLPEAQAFLKQQVDVTASLAVNAQSVIYSTVQLVSGDLSALLTKDYPTYSLSAYQAFIDAQVTSEFAVIDAALDIAALFDYNPYTLDIVP